jgi:hypothetical protein
MPLVNPPMQYQLVRKGDAFTRIAVQFTDEMGMPITLTANPVARIYRINPADGSMVLDTAMGTSGLLPLPVDALLTGLYGAALALSPALYEHYEIFVQYNSSVSPASPSYTRITLFLSEDLKSIYDNRNVELLSKRTGYAPG